MRIDQPSGRNSTPDDGPPERGERAASAVASRRSALRRGPSNASLSPYDVGTPSAEVARTGRSSDGESDTGGRVAIAVIGVRALVEHRETDSGDWIVRFLPNMTRHSGIGRSPDGRLHRLPGGSDYRDAQPGSQRPRSGDRPMCNRAGRRRHDDGYSSAWRTPGQAGSPIAPQSCGSGRRLHGPRCAAPKAIAGARASTESSPIERLRIFPFTGAPRAADARIHGRLAPTRRPFESIASAAASGRIGRRVDTARLVFWRSDWQPGNASRVSPEWS